MLDSIKDSFTESIQIQIAAAEALPDAITHAAQAMVASLLNGNKILCCGNGGSSSNAQQFVSCLLNRFETERPSLPAMALTADNTTLTAVANDYHYEEIFSKQVRAFGQTGDICWHYPPVGIVKYYQPGSRCNKGHDYHRSYCKDGAKWQAYSVNRCRDQKPFPQNSTYS